MIDGTIQRADAPDLIRYAKETGLETALSTTGDFVTPEILAYVSLYLELISLPLDGWTEAINSRSTAGISLQLCDL